MPPAHDVQDPLTPTASRPVPARVIVQLDPAVFGPDVPAGTRVSADGAAVEFHTAAAAVVPPVTLVAVERPPGGDRLRLTLATSGPWRGADLRLPPRVDTDGPSHGLRLFVHDPGTYRALTRGPVRGEVNCGGTTTVLSDDAIRPAGFDLGDALLPADPREPEAVRLLAEWATCPEKFLFLDLVGMWPDLPGRAVDVDLLLEAEAVALLGDRVPVLRLGCVPAVNRRTVELPPVPLHGGEVRVDGDPLSGEGDRRLVVDVQRVRAVRAGRTVATYAERLAPLPPPLAARPAGVGRWSLRRRDDRAWLSLDDRGAGGPGRTLLVTAACCRRALPGGPAQFAPGVVAVGPVRPPVRPASGADLRSTEVGPLLAAVLSAFGGRPVEVRAEIRAVAAQRPTGMARGVDVRLTFAAGGLPLDETYLLARVLDHAVATAGPVDGFTRVVALTAVGDVLTTCPPRAGKDPLAGPPGPFSDGPEAGVSGAAGTRRFGPLSNAVRNRHGRSADQATAVAVGFAAVARPMSVTALAGVLRHLLGLPVRVRPFEPVRVVVDPAAQMRLSGTGRVLGGRQQGWGVRVVIGPLDRRTFDRFAPGTRATRRVRQLLSTAVGSAAVVQPVLRAGDVPPWSLGRGRLGRSLWLGRRPTDSNFGGAGSHPGDCQPPNQSYTDPSGLRSVCSRMISDGKEIAL